MRGNKNERTEAIDRSLDEAMARVRRQFRITNILLVIVGIEAIVFVGLRAWGVL